MSARSIGELAAKGLVVSSPRLNQVADRYAVAISDELLATMDSPAIRRQFLPSEAELLARPEEHADPIGDATHSPVAGIVHRHRDRVLLKAVAACPVYCRFCFRREQIGPASENALSVEELNAAIAYIAAHPEIWEVILTGGDPFILSPRRAALLSSRLAAIPHVKVIRWHTRVPVVDPSRVTDDFVAALLVPGATSYVALHANHPDEFGAEARRAIALLADAGIPLVSQSVLLRGINDDIETLETLMRTFVENRVTPYYLHHPDLAPGTSHFRVSIKDGIALTRKLRARASGLAQPLYVIDIPGGHAKIAVDSDAVMKTETGYRLRDPDGRWHDYSESLA